MTHDFKCKARNAYPEPQDCDWPWCGCDPEANRVLEGIEENDCLIIFRADYDKAIRAAVEQERKRCVEIVRAHAYGSAREAIADAIEAQE